MSAAPLIEITDAGKGIRVVRMQSPPVNAWTDEFIAALEDALLRLEQTNARAVVVTGFGRYFSAGGDFKRFQHITDEQRARSFVVQVQGIMDRVAAIPVPVIGAINGAALGGGSNSRSPATCGSPAPRSLSGFPSRGGGFSPGPAAPSGWPDWSDRAQPNA